MDFKILETSHNGRVFKIEEDYPEVGVYLYVYEDEMCVKDFLQNDIKTCKELAMEDYGVPLSAWQENTKNEEE